MSDVDELKKRFKQGAVPDESDYASLITLANPVTGNGLEVASGRLNVKAGDGISAGEGGVSVNVDRTTLDVTGGVLGVKLQAGGNSGLDSAGGLHVKTGAGLKADAAGLGVDLAENSGLAHDREVEGRWPLYVNVDEKTSGLEFDAATHKLQVKVPKNEKNYLVTGPEGLSLTADGITKMKAELETVTSAALNQAVAVTKSGKDKDPVDATTMEGRIAKALNDAHDDGYSIRRKEDGDSLSDAVRDTVSGASKDTKADPVSTTGQIAKALNDAFTAGAKSVNDLKPEVKNPNLRYPVTGASYTVDLAKDSGVVPRNKGHLTFTANQDPNGDLWSGLVKGLKSDGQLTLTGKATETNPLWIAVTETASDPVVGAQIKVELFDAKITINPEVTVKYNKTINLNELSLVSAGEIKPTSITYKYINGTGASLSSNILSIAPDTSRVEVEVTVKIPNVPDVTGHSVLKIDASDAGLVWTGSTDLFKSAEYQDGILKITTYPVILHHANQRNLGWDDSKTTTIWINGHCVKGELTRTAKFVLQGTMQDKDDPDPRGYFLIYLGGDYHANLINTNPEFAKGYTGDYKLSAWVADDTVIHAENNGAAFKLVLQVSS